MVGMVCLVSAVVLFALAVFVYMKGVRPGQSWGVPLLIVCLLGMGAALLVRSRSVQWPHRYPRIERLAGHLADDLPRGARVLFLMRHPHGDYLAAHPMARRALEVDYPVSGLEEWVEMQTAELKRAFEQGAGFRIEVVGNVCVAGGTLEEFDAVLAPYKGESLDLIVSEWGKPAADFDTLTYGLEALDISSWDRVPMFATIDGLAASGIFNPAMLRDYMRRDVLCAVLLLTRPMTGHEEDDEAARFFLTGSNLHALPDNAPHGPYSADAQMGSDID